MAIQYVDWVSASGRCYCNVNKNMASSEAEWWYPARILNIPLVDYVKMLVEEYKVDHIHFDGKTLVYSWSNYANCHKFVLNINKQLRKVQK